MSKNSGVSYEDVIYRKGGLYQGVSSLISGKNNDYRREVTWGNSINTFNGTTTETFGHEFGHIIQYNRQGWGQFQGRGIYEQLLIGFKAYRPDLWELPPRWREAVSRAK